MENKYNWKCRICGWKMYIDPEIRISDKAFVLENGHVIRCGKCGSMFKSRD